MTIKVKINKLPKSEIEIEGEMPFPDLEKYRPNALKKLGQNLNLPGFRKGHVPESIVLEKIGTANLLNEMAEQALGKVYPQIIIENKINPITRPQMTITKMAMGNPLGFKIKVPVMPELSLPDYKKIAKEVSSQKEEVEVKEADIEKVVDQVLESRKDSDGKKPELTDELVKTLGHFKDLNDFNEKVKEGVKKEKEWRAKERIRIQIMEKIISETEANLPEVIVESELDKMIAGFKNDVEKMGLKLDEYLKKNNKTIENLKQEWRSEAQKRAKSQLIINKIAIDEKIYPKAEEVQKEAEHLLEHYKGSDPDRIKVYVETILTNEEVMKWLESGAGETIN